MDKCVDHKTGTPSRIAVIGAGISGITAAWLLSRRYAVTLIEKESRLQRFGGNTTKSEDVYNQPP